MHRYFWLGLLALLSAARPGGAQQLLCERTLLWPASANVDRGYLADRLLRLQADSLRLLGDFRALTTPSTVPAVTSLRRLRIGTCDTLPVPGSAWQPNAAPLFGNSRGLVTRQGYVLMSGSGYYGSTAPAQVRLLGRDGRPRWTSILPNGRFIGALLEAPDHGFFVVLTSSISTGARLARLDSLGRVLWQRQIGKGSFQVFTAAYTRTDNLLLYGVGEPGYNVGLQEVSQNGDTLRRLNPVAALAPASVNVNVSYREHLQELRDGGFLLTATTDSLTPSGTGTGYVRPTLIRLNRSLQVVWTHTYWALPYSSYSICAPYELADGSLVALVLAGNSGYLGQPYWLFRYSASGQLLQRYPFSSSALTALHQTGSNGDVRFIGVAGMQPLSDSTFMLAANVDNYLPNSQQRRVTYLAHLKVAGLRRVVDSHYIPAANSPLATATPATGPPLLLGEAHPNPASETVVMTYQLPAGSGAAQLVVRDLLGRVVLTVPLPGTMGEVNWSVRELAPGLYAGSLEAGGRVLATRKLAVVH